MSGDYSRRSFNPRKDFSGVLMQQGRVQLDSDWNELVEIHNRRLRAETVDIIGRRGVPQETPDGFKIEIESHELTIGLGRIYVDGLLTENHGLPPLRFDSVLAETTGTERVIFIQQPFYPSAVHHGLSNEHVHLVYLDVWQREVTHLQDPELVETAIGIDTTTRMQTVWQVRVLPNVATVEVFQAGCGLTDQQLVGWAYLTQPSGARLSTDEVQVAQEEDPCLIPPTGGYRGLENRLYRIAIHELGGDNGYVVKFKFSRDNASIAAAVEKIETDSGITKLTINPIGRDQIQRFRPGDWIEVLDDHVEFRQEVGRMAQVDKVLDNNVLVLDRDVSDVLDADNLAPRHARVIRWDHQPDDLDDLEEDELSEGLRRASENAWVDLEDGIRVKFNREELGEYKRGDYWTFAARVVGGIVEPLDEAPPQGIHHHYCRLAIIEGGEGFTIHDNRPLFPSLSEMTRLEYVGGDGQETDPDASLPRPLEVAVMNGQMPVEGRRVRFEILDNLGGTLTAAPGYDSDDVSPTSLTVFTNANGIAACDWSLDTAAKLGATPAVPPRSQQVAASLLDLDCEPIEPPIRFNANLSLNGFFYVSGDGQESKPDGRLPAPLQVAVVNDYRPVANAVVRFEIKSGAGGVLENPLGTPRTIPYLATTDNQGIATAYWRLDTALGSSRYQQVEASLLDAAVVPIPIHHSIRFNAARCVPFLHQIGGDGQQALADEFLCGPLQVRFTCGLTPVQGVAVEFTIVRGNGTLMEPLTTNQGSSIQVTTKADGLAEVSWQLNTDPEDKCHRVVATVVGSDFTTEAKPVFFNAEEIQPSSGTEPGIHVVAVELVVNTTLTVVDATALPSAVPFNILIDREELTVTAIAGNVFTVTRGVNGTSVAKHADRASVLAVQGSTLTGAISAFATTLAVADAARFPVAADFNIRIDTEELTVTRIIGNVFTVIRGANGTAAAAHANSAVNLVRGSTLNGALGTGPSLPNDANITFGQLKRGIRLRLDGPLEANSVHSANCFVSVERPVFVGIGPSPPAYLRWTLAARITAVGRQILWEPTAESQTLLEDWGREPSFNQPLLAHIDVLGNYIWGRTEIDIRVPPPNADFAVTDGETFTILHGQLEATFEFDDIRAGTGVLPRNVPIPFDPGMRSTELANAIVKGITSPNVGFLRIGAQVIDRETIKLTGTAPIAVKIGSARWLDIVDLPDSPRLYLDGDTFGRPAVDGSLAPGGRPATHLDLPSGNGLRGGAFELWFWLRERVSVRDPLLDFGGVFVGQTNSLNTSIFNAGETDYVARLEVTSPTARTFALAANQAQHVLVSPGQTVPVDVLYSPRETGDHGGELRIVPPRIGIQVPSGGGAQIADGDTFTISSAAPVLVRFEFDSNGIVTAGNVPVIVFPGMSTAELANAVGNAITSAKIGIVAISDTTSTVRLASANSINVDVSLTPTLAKVFFPDEQSFTVALTGRGIRGLSEPVGPRPDADPQVLSPGSSVPTAGANTSRPTTPSTPPFKVSSTELDFGHLALGNRVTRSLTVRNNVDRKVSVRIELPPIAGLRASAATLNLAKGSSERLRVVYKPEAAGDLQATIILSAESQTREIELKGTTA